MAESNYIKEVLSGVGRHVRGQRFQDEARGSCTKLFDRYSKAAEKQGRGGGGIGQSTPTLSGRRSTRRVDVKESKHERRFFLYRLFFNPILITWTLPAHAGGVTDPWSQTIIATISSPRPVHALDYMIAGWIRPSPRPTIFLSNFPSSHMVLSVPNNGIKIANSEI